MRICIDGLALSNLKGTGYYTYMLSLCNGLFYMYPQSRYNLILGSAISIPEWKRYQNVTFSEVDVKRRMSALLEQEMIKNKADLFFSAYNGFSLPSNKLTKYMMAVHDLAPLSIPDMVDEYYTTKFNTKFHYALQIADIILAVSEFIKKEILEYYQIPEKKIKVIYPRVLDIFKPVNRKDAKEVIKRKYRIIKEFIMFTGSIHKRKNMEILIYSFYELTKQSKDICLVVVGDYNNKRREYYTYLLQLVWELNIQDKIIFTGIVDLMDMPYFYNSCICAINLSIYEGFPMTAVEAAACGTPYICMKNTSFPELNLPNYIYLDKLEVNLLTSLLFKVITNYYNRNFSVLKSFQPFRFGGEEETKKLVRVIEDLIYL